MIYQFLKYYLKRILKKDRSKWILGLIHGDINYNSLKKTIFFKPPNNEFWADPFLFCRKKSKYIFFENFKKKSNKGVISVGEIKGDKLINVKDILSRDYHLSYPFIFKKGKSIFLIPETHEKKRLEVYIAKKFPYKWALYSTAFHGEIVADPTILFYKKKMWLFLNKTKDKLNKLNKDLYIYQINDLKFTKITPHKKNPVISDYLSGRNAGNIFVDKKKIYRPSQINKKNIYGYGLCLSEIKKLNLNIYIERKVQIIEPNFFKKLKGVHHLSKDGKFNVMDFNFY